MDKPRRGASQRNDAQVLGHRHIVHAEKQHFSRLDRSIRLWHQPSGCGREQILPAKGLRPVRSVWRHSFWLGTNNFAPHPANKPKAVGSGALARLLMAVRGADPPAGDRNNPFLPVPHRKLPPEPALAEVG